MNFAGNFSSLGINYKGYTNWAFTPSQSINPVSINSFLNISNNLANNDSSYLFKTGNTIDMSASLFSLGHINYIAPNLFNYGAIMTYVGSLQNYSNYFNLKSPFNGLYNLVNYYTQSAR